jgi:colanic acid biosynthesis glycosyl transferase WcaI
MAEISWQGDSVRVGDAPGGGNSSVTGDPLFNCFLTRKATKNIVSGEKMRRRLVDGKGADQASTVVIPNWADGSKISPEPKRNPFSERHGLTDKFVVMHSGNLGLSQDLGMLVEAAALLRGTPEVEIVMIGDGVE